MPFSSIQAWTSERRQTVTLGLSLIGAGKAPRLTQFQIVLSETPISPFDAGRAFSVLTWPLLRGGPTCLNN